MPFREWKTVARFNDMNVAQVCAGMLRENGIEPFFPDEGLVSVWPAFRTKRGYIRLQVPAEEEQQALELLGRERDVEEREPVESPWRAEPAASSTSGIQMLFALVLFLCVILLIYRFFPGGN